MSEQSMTAGEDAQGRYCYRLEELEARPLQPAVSTSIGAVVKGEHMFVGLVKKARGSGSQPHRHPFEQFNYVLKGTLKATIAGKEELVHAGGLIHIPKDTVHSIVTTANEDAEYLMIKNVTPFGMAGIAEDETVKGPIYLAGYEPKE